MAWPLVLDPALESVAAAPLIGYPGLALALVLLAGVLGQWLAQRLRVPSILVLLLVGLLVGPTLQLIDVDALLGGLLFPIVSLSVAAILFEGGLSLDRRELKEIGPLFWRLILIGIPVTFALSALAGIYVLGLDLRLALLLAAILVVTGPTVTLPLLAHIRPRGNIAALLKWEGIVNDPIGAIIAVLLLEWAVGQQAGATGHAALGMLRAGLIGAGLGGAGAYGLGVLLRRRLLPEHLESSMVLATVLASFALSNALQHESGLLTVTLLGIGLANQRGLYLEHIIEFKENLRTFLIGSLFVLLAARIRWEQLVALGPESLIFVACLILLVRPLAVAAACLGLKVPLGEQAFMAAMAPRGIVAAAVSSLFALELTRAGVPGAQLFAPMVFLVILSTVTVYGLSAGPIARRVGLASAKRNGVLILGAHPLARAIARVLTEEKLSVVLVDSNRRNVTEARLAGLNAFQASIRSDYVLEHLPLHDVGCFLALLSNDEVNTLAVMRFRSLFGRASLYQLPPEASTRQPGQSGDRFAEELPGRLLFAPSATYRQLEARFTSGWQLKRTRLTEDFGFPAFQAHYAGQGVALFVLPKSGGLRPITAETPPTTEPGDRILALAPPSTAPTQLPGNPHPF